MSESSVNPKEWAVHQDPRIRLEEISTTTEVKIITSTQNMKNQDSITPMRARNSIIKSQGTGIVAKKKN